MDYQALFSRILTVVDREAYLTPSVQVDVDQRDAMRQLERAIQAPDFEPEGARELASRLLRESRIDKVMYFSALHVIAAHPRVADWREAGRMAAEQEQAALELGGPGLTDNLASVDRHRGVLAFLQGHYELALDYLSRAFERQHNAENLGNVLCVLIRLGDLAEAGDLLAKVRASFHPSFIRDLDRRIQADPDLALLRDLE